MHLSPPLLSAGRADGSVTTLRQAVGAGDPQQASSWKIQSTKRLANSIVQLEVARERDLLLCLTDEGVNLYSLPQLQLKGQAATTSGASCFAWDDDASLLAVAVKRR